MDQLITARVGQRKVVHGGPVRTDLIYLAGEDTHDSQYAVRTHVHVGHVHELAGTFALAAYRTQVFAAGREHQNFGELTVEDVDVAFLVVHDLRKAAEKQVVVFAAPLPQHFGFDADGRYRRLRVLYVRHAVFFDFGAGPLRRGATGQGASQKNG